MLKQFAGIILLTVLAACQTVGSAGVDTDNIYPTIEARSDGTTTDVSATFRQDSLTSLVFIELTEGDFAEAIMRAPGSTTDEVKAMSHLTIAGLTSYYTSFTASAEGTKFTVNLDRAGSGKTSAPDSFGTLPLAFSATLTGGPDFQRGVDAITIDWAPSGEAEPLTYSAMGDCIDNLSDVPITGDSGSVTITSGALVASSGAEANTCEVTVRIRRVRSGAIDAAYGGGVFRGVQYDEVVFNSTPAP